MRIIRGKYKTRKYKFPKGFPSRPTTDFAKEGLFNILEHNYTNSNLNILDLCVGTGSISIEFLSREIGNVVAIDNNQKVIKNLKSVIKKLNCEDEIKVYKSDLITFLENTELQFDLIFTDPPYSFKKYESIIKLIYSRNILNKNGVLIIEHSKNIELENLKYFKFSRIYGNVKFSFFE